jgi:hypothetical protein
VGPGGGAAAAWVGDAAIAVVKEPMASSVSRTSARVRGVDGPLPARSVSGPAESGPLGPGVGGGGGVGDQVTVSPGVTRFSTCATETGVTKSGDGSVEKPSRVISASTRSLA